MNDKMSKIRNSVKINTTYWRIHDFVCKKNLDLPVTIHILELNSKDLKKKRKSMLSGIAIAIVFYLIYETSKTLLNVIQPFESRMQGIPDMKTPLPESPEAKP